MFHNNHLYVSFRPFRFCKGFNQDWIDNVNKTHCVYFLVNDNEGIKRTAADIKGVNAVFIDIDGTMEWDGKTGSIVVGRDKTHWHAYWPLVAGEDIATWKKVQRALIRHFGSDPACSDPSRVMRVWGSVNRKPDAGGAVYATWKKEDKKWTLDEIVGFFGLELDGDVDYSGVKMSMEGVECPVAVRDDLKGDIERKTVDEGSRYVSARDWSKDALGAGMDPLEVHSLAKSALIRWGYDNDYADRQAWNAQSGTLAKLESGALMVDERLRPDLAFSSEVEEVVLKAEEVEEQEKALGCSSLIKGLKVADDKFDWLKANASKVAQLDTIEMGKIRAAWGQGVRMFDAAVREAMGGGEDFDWGKIADNFLAERKTPLIFVDGEWFSWNGKCYEVVDEIWVKKEISDTINEPTTSKVSNAYQQLQFSALKKFEGEPEGTPFLNGRLVKGALVPHTPKNGGRYCLGFNYDPTAVCPIWEQSLKEWFNDSERPLILRQWLHYLITGRSEIQKIMLFVGIQRGGKGTIISVIQSLIGEDNYSTPSMGNFASDFGLQSSLGRRALFISDAHLPQRDRSTILDRLKGISGKDRIDVNRKNLPPIKGARLGQIIIACNQMEDIKDESNALIDRYSLIKFTNSFLGKEDTERGANIEKELSGIFNWAMNCPAFTRFHEDKKGADVKDEMSQSANPVRAWSKSCCVEDPFTDTKTDDLYKSFEVWCDDNSIKYVMPKNAFIRSVKNVFPDAEVKLVRDGKKSRYKMMSGVKIDLEGLPEDELEAF